MENTNLLIDDMPITGISIQEDISIITVRNLSSDGKACAECFKTLGELNINVDMISQQSTGNNTCSISFSCSRQQAEELKAAIEKGECFIDGIMEYEENLAMISLVGVGMATHSGVASQVFNVLAENEIRYYHITTSEISITVTVDMEWKIKAALALCREFNL